MGSGESCVCLEEKTNLVAYPCGHSSVCLSCDMQWKGTCRLCRADKKNTDYFPNVRACDKMWRVGKIYNAVANNRIDTCAICMKIAGKKFVTTGCCRLAVCCDCVREEAIAFATGFTGKKPECFCCGAKKWKIVRKSDDVFQNIFLTAVHEITAA